VPRNSHTAAKSRYRDTWGGIGLGWVRVGLESPHTVFFSTVTVPIEETVKRPAYP